MAKGQMRGNKEARKPKTKKEAAPPPAGFTKGALSATATTAPKKKG